MPWRAADVEIDATPPDDGDGQTATDGRTVVGRLVPYGTAATIRDPDGATFAETWARGAAQAADPLLVYAWHDPSSGERGPLIGRAVAVAQADDGLHASLRIADSTDGRDALALLREGLDGLSVEFTPDVDQWDKAKRAVTRERAVVSAVAFAARPAHLTARVLQVRSEPERQPVTDTLTPTEPDTPPDDDPQPDEDVRAATHLRSIADTRGARTTTSPTPVSQFRSLGEFAQAVALGAIPREQRDVYFRALADQLTTDVPGLVHGTWVREVVDLIAEVAGSLAAFRSVALPSSGNQISIPKVTQGPDVGPQAVEKTDISTRKVLIDAANFPVKTYAGGQDISIATIERSDPSYLDLLMRLYAKEMQLQVCTDFGAALVAGATAGGAWPSDAKLINAALVGAAVDIMTATFSAPQVAVLGINAWAQMGAAVDADGRPLFPTVSPTNPVGSFDLTTPSGQVRGLAYYADPTLAVDTVLVGLRDAALSMLGPVGTLSADVPAKLGRDVAVYRFAAFGVVDARGLIKFTGAVAPAGASSTRSSKGS